MTSDRHLALMALMALMREIDEPTKTYQRSIRLAATLGSETLCWNAAVERGNAALDDIEQAVRGWVAAHPEPGETDELQRLRNRVRELERPAIEAQRAEIRGSFSELIAQCEQDRDFEGAFEVQCRLREREAQWSAEDAAAPSA